MSTLTSLLLFLSTHFFNQPQTTNVLAGRWNLIKMVVETDTLFNRDNRAADSALYFSNANIRQRFAHDATPNGDIGNFNELRTQTTRIYIEIDADSLSLFLPGSRRKNDMERTPALYYAPMKDNDNATRLYHDKEMSDDPSAELVMEKNGTICIIIEGHYMYFKKQ